MVIEGREQIDLHNIESVENRWIWWTILSRNKVIPIGNEAGRSIVSVPLTYARNGPATDEISKGGNSKESGETKGGSEGMAVRQLHDLWRKSERKNEDKNIFVLSLLYSNEGVFSFNGQWTRTVIDKASVSVFFRSSTKFCVLVTFRECITTNPTSRLDLPKCRALLVPIFVHDSFAGA